MNSAVARAFDGADHYDDAARVQAHAAQQLAGRIAALPLPPTPRILEIGCGTGLLSQALISHIAGAKWLLTDIAPAMLERCATRIGPNPQVSYAIVDGERPVVDGRFDLICSNFAFQWFADLPHAIDQLKALLSPSGTLAFATMAAGSFAEWDEAHRAATGTRAAMAAYPSADELRATGAMVELERVTETHHNARAFLASLRAIGAHRPRARRRPVPAPALRRAMAAFEVAGATVTYNIAYGTIPL